MAGESAVRSIGAPLWSSLLCVALVVAGCATEKPANRPAVSSSSCSKADVDGAQTAHQLQELAKRCVESDSYLSVVAKLNSLPVPMAPTLKLKLAPEGGRSDQVIYEADVFFDFLQSYPSDIALQKLAELISRMSESYRVTQVEIKGGNSPNEERLSPWKLGVQRADFVERYLMSAGLDPTTRIVFAKRDATEADTPLGRARDRVVELKVTTLRQHLESQASTKSQVASASKVGGNPISREKLDEMRRKAKGLPDSKKKEELDAVLDEMERRIDEQDQVRYIEPSLVNSSDEATKAYVARYTTRIEDCGNSHFPSSADKRLYGSPVVKAYFTLDGGLKSASVTKTSGIPQLDAHAIKVVEASAPFGPVPRRLAEGGYRTFAFLAAFNFVHDGSTPPVSSLPKAEKCRWAE